MTRSKESERYLEGFNWRQPSRSSRVNYLLGAFFFPLKRTAAAKTRRKSSALFDIIKVRSPGLKGGNSTKRPEGAGVRMKEICHPSNEETIVRLAKQRPRRPFARSRCGVDSYTIARHVR